MTLTSLPNAPIGRDPSTQAIDIEARGIQQGSLAICLWPFNSARGFASCRGQI